jgi:hypothetical protein
VHQDGKRFAISSSGLFDQVSIHLDPSPMSAPVVAAVKLYDGSFAPKRSVAVQI